MGTQNQGLHSSALEAASTLIEQATVAAQAWNSEVQAVNKSADDQIKQILMAKESANQAHQLMVSNLNKAHSQKLKSYDEKIQAVNKVRDIQLIGLEAKNAPINLADSKVVQSVDKAASKGLESVGVGIGWFTSKIKSGMAKIQ